MRAASEKQPKPTSPEAWLQAPRLGTVEGPPQPELISDGGGLPFPAALALAAGEPLDAADPAVAALIVQIDRGRQQAQPPRLLRPKRRPEPMTVTEKLAGWRELARTDGEVLFGRGLAPRLLTVAARRVRGDRWEPLGASNSRPLRAVRDGVRASSWRLDPSTPPRPDQLELRVLVTERTMATGTPVADRLLAPELYIDAQRALLRVYVRPLEGYVGRTSRHETPVVVLLPEPLGSRSAVDGALYEPPQG